MLIRLISHYGCFMHCRAYGYYALVFLSLSATSRYNFFAFLVFGILLIALGYFEVFILFVILTWALKNKDRIVYGVTLVVFAFVLWQLYYSLQLSFLAKSASILVSGIILLALYGLLMKEAKINCIEGEK